MESKLKVIYNKYDELRLLDRFYSLSNHIYKVEGKPLILQLLEEREKKDPGGLSKKHLSIHIDFTKKNKITRLILDNTPSL